VTCLIVRKRSPSMSVGLALKSTISNTSAPLELEDAQQEVAVAALREVARLVGGSRELPKLLGGDEPLAVGGRLGSADQEPLAALLAGDPRLRVQQGVEGPDVEPLRGERELADLEASLLQEAVVDLAGLELATSITLLS
jgi:hypothetical protein